MPRDLRNRQPVIKNKQKSPFNKKSVKSAKPKPQVNKLRLVNKLPVENIELHKKVYNQITEKMLPMLVSSGINAVEAEQMCRLFATTVVVRIMSGQPISDDAYAMAYPELSGFDWSAMDTGMKKKAKKTKRKSRGKKRR
jgi:hypothetical protein